MAQNPLRPGLALLIIVAGHTFASIFMRNLGAGIDDIADPAAARIARIFYSALQLIIAHLAPFFAAFLLFIVYRVWRGKDAQWGIDILGGLLLMQLILFLPVITLNFGWLYWRLDAGARMKGGKDIRFAEDDDSPSPFDYFHIATRALLQFEPSGASAVSKTMKNTLRHPRYHDA